MLSAIFNCAFELISECGRFHEVDVGLLEASHTMM
jgi:hypothetical protein